MVVIFGFGRGNQEDLGEVAPGLYCAAAKRRILDGR